MKSLRQIKTPLNERYTITYKEAADLLGVNIDTLKRVAKDAGAIVKFGKSARVILPKLKAYVDSLQR